MKRTATFIKNTWVILILISFQSFSQTVIFSDDFETDMGWTLTGEFERDAPSGLGGQFGNPDPSSAYGGTHALGTDLTGLGSHHGDYEANLTDREYMATSPAFDCSSFTELTLKFQQYLNVEDPLSDRAYIDISNDNGASWVNIFTNLTEVTDDSWALKTFDISAQVAGYAQVKIRFAIGVTDGSFPVSSLYSGWNVDDLSVEGSNCAAPSNQYETDKTTNSANLHWTENGIATTWNIEWGTEGFTPGTGTTVVSLTSIPYALSGLSVGTAYDWYVQADCGSGQSSWTGPSNFSTLCTAFSIPFSEGFNSGSTTQDCWVVLNENDDNVQWNMNFTSNPYEGDEVALIETDGNGGDNDDWLISPPITLSGNEQVRYFYRVQSSIDPNDFEVLLSTTGNNPADFTNTLLPLTVYTNSTYQEETIDLSAYSGTVFVAWRVPPGGVDGWRLYIDYINFETIPTCPKPSSQAVHFITPSSADLYWTENGSATTWDIEWGATGFTPGTGTLIPGATTKPYPLSGLTINTTYDWYIRSDCGGGDLSDWIGPHSFTTTCGTYHAPYSQDFADNDIPECWNMSGPEDWIFSTGAGYGAAAAGDHTPGGGTNYAWVDGSGAPGSGILLETPMIDVSTLGAPAIEFWYFSNNTDNPGDNNTLIVDFWDGLGWNNIYNVAADDPDWQQVVLNVSGFAITGPVQLRFIVDQTADQAYHNDILIDDISIHENIVEWTGTTSTDWHTASNWSPSGVPDETTAVLIPNVTNLPLVSTANADCRLLTVDPSATVTVTGSFVLHVHTDEAPVIITTQQLAIVNGWGLISFNNMPEIPDLMTILQPLIDDNKLIKVIDEAGEVIQNIPGIGWVNQIGDMYNTEGYHIKLNDNANLEVTGIPAELPFLIPLSSGWNIMGYPLQQSQDGLDAVDPLIDNNELVKVIDGSGGFIEYIPGSGWVNTIGDFVAGQGYQINVNTLTSLTLDKPPITSFVGASRPTPLQSPKQTMYFPNFFNNPYSPMNIVVKNIQIDGLDVQNGGEIGIYQGEMCVGSLAVHDSLMCIVARMDDPLTEEIDGFTEGKTISFKFMSPQLNEPVYLKARATYGEDDFESLGTFGCDLKGKLSSMQLNSLNHNPSPPTFKGEEENSNK